MDSAFAILRRYTRIPSLYGLTSLLVLDNQRSQACSRWKSHKRTLQSEGKKLRLTLLLTVGGGGGRGEGLFGRTIHLLTVESVISSSPRNTIYFLIILCEAGKQVALIAAALSSKGNVEKLTWAV